MHDPMTVAFEIKYPWPKYWGGERSEWQRRYHESFITIWHVDPEKGHNHGNRADDSCGWFRPPTTQEERDHVREIGQREYSTLFGKRSATQEGKSYAYISFEPTPYDAVYWAWRQLKYEGSRHKWKFGPYRRTLSAAELEEIYLLATNPVDNLQHSVAEVQNAEQCGQFFLTVYRCMTRFYRPWFKHPRWHFWHWKVQVHPLQKLHRWLFVRCDECGERFGWNESPIGNWGGTRRWHDRCDHSGPRGTSSAAPKPVETVN